MRKIGFAVFFVVAIVGAVLLIISQVPLTREYYDVVDTRSFSPGQRLTFSRTFEAGAKYRFEVIGVDQTTWPLYSPHHLSITDSPYLSREGDDPVQAPWVWYWNSAEWAIQVMVNVTFWHYGNGQEIDQAYVPTSVEISVLRATTYRLTYLIYGGLPLLIIGVILITITERNVDHTPKVSELSVHRISI